MNIRSFLMVLVLLKESLSLTYDYLPVYRDPPPVRLYSTLTYSSFLDSLIVFGGQLDGNNNYNDLWTYSFSNTQWQQQTSSNRLFPSNSYSGERFSHGTFNIEDRDMSCIFAGTTAYGPLNDLWCFSFFSLKWLQLTTSGDEVEPRYRFYSASYTYTDGKSYFAIFGGDSKKGKLNDICILDISSLAWTCITPSSAPFSRSGGTMEYYNGFLYIAAGDNQDSSAQINDFYRFNLATSVWEDITHASTYESVTLTDSVIYQNYFYLFFGWQRTVSKDSPKIFRADLNSDFEWTEVADFASLARDSFAVSIKDSNAYVFAGFTPNGLANDVVSLDLSKSPIEFSKTEVMKTPPLRVYHSFEPIYGSLYLFGGDSEGHKLSDLWSFDITSEQWNSIEATGNPPSARSNHGSASLGDSLIILGGINESGYLNDIFKYSVNSNSWEELTSVSSLVPTPRASMCVVLSNPYIYIYGGITETGLSSELWRYDIGLHEYELIDAGNIDGPRGINKHSCSIEYTGDDTLFYVMFGTGEAETARGEVHYFSLNQHKWFLVHKSDNSRNGAAINKINDKIVVAGGETWGIFPQKKVLVIDLSSCSGEKCNETEIGNLEDFFLNGASTYYLNYVFFHGGSDPLGDIIRTSVPRNSFYRIDLSSYLDCSLGSESIDSNCEFCKKGYYNEVYNSACIACEKGFYNAFEGSSSFRQCFPCEEGTFNPFEGSHYCLDCPAQAQCPLGASAYKYENVQLYELSSQPDFYDYRTDEASNISFLLIISTALLGLGAIVLFVFWKKLHKILIALDMFDTLHSFGVGNVVTLTKNKFGGIFTIIFYIAALMLVLSTIPSYAIDNLLETKALVPYIIVESDYDFYSNLMISVDLDGYYAPCANSLNECDSSIKLTMFNIDYEGEISQKCEETEDSCIIQFECEECAINSSSYLEFDLSHANSYSSGILVNATTSSSIPDKFSSVTYSIRSDTGTVFRGGEPSQFYFSMVSSLYKNSINGQEKTGYHTIIRQAADSGSAHSTLDIPFTSNMIVKLELSRSENCLMTLHDERYPIIILIFTLLGSISGALGAIGAVMANIEKFYTRTKRSLKKKRDIKELFARRENYKIFLQDVNKGEEDQEEGSQRLKTYMNTNRNFDKTESQIDGFD